MRPTLIVGLHGSGKTTKCIRLAHEHNAHIVCANHARAHSIDTQAIMLKCKIPHPITYQEFISGSFNGRDITGFIIDDIDDLVAYLARGTRILAMSICAQLTPVTPQPAPWESPETQVSNRLDTDEHDKGQNT